MTAIKNITHLIRYAASLLENLSKLEHQQWMDWAKGILKEEDISEERRKRWEELFIPYDKLSEKEKEKDREYARKIMQLLKKD